MTPTEPAPHQAFDCCGPYTGPQLTHAAVEALAEWGPAEDWSNWFAPTTERT